MMTDIQIVPGGEWFELAQAAIGEPDPDKRAAIFDQMFALYAAEPRGATQSGLPYPAPTDPIAQGADAIRALAEALEYPRWLARMYTPVTYTLTTANVPLPGASLQVPVKAGQRFNVVARVMAWNSASGASRTATFRLIENGVNLTPTFTYPMVFVAGSTALPCFVEVPRTAAADGTLTFTVGGMASVNSTCTVTDCEIEAISMPPGSTQEMAVGDDELRAIEEALNAERDAAGVE